MLPERRVHPSHAACSRRVASCIRQAPLGAHCRLVLQAPGAAQLPAALAHEQYALGLNRQLLGQGVVGGHPGLPQGLEGVGLSRGFDQLFPPGGARALGGVSAAGGHVPLLPLQVSTTPPPHMGPIRTACQGVLPVSCMSQASAVSTAGAEPAWLYTV